MKGPEQNELQARLERVREELRDASDGVVIADRAGNAEWVNEAFSRATGYTKTEALDRAPALRPFGERTGADCACFWRSVLSGQEWSGVVNGRRKDGSNFPVQLTVVPLSHPCGRVRYLVAVHAPVAADAGDQTSLEALRKAVGAHPVQTVTAPGWQD